MKAIIRNFIFLFALPICSANVYALPPQTLDYQGYLASSGGVPLTGSVNVSISLYTAASGGATLWTQASSPTLNNGRFTVVLDGSGGNAFPASVFDQALFVGLTVDTDPEMTPRQPLTSVPSAFEAMNADTLDGLQANEIIAAASDEVRTPISSLPFSISASGSYYLTQSFIANSGGINVNADNVTIDLMGFTLDGNGTNDYGISLSSRNAVVIKNGTIREFGRAGIYNGGATGNTNVVSDVQVIANGSLGSSSSYSGIYLVGTSNRVERCIAKDNASYGIYAGRNSIVKDSSAENSGGSYGIYGGNGSTLVNNGAYANSASGIGSGVGSTLTNNTAYSNSGSGIVGGTGSTLKNNTAYLNQNWGIFAGGASVVKGNTVVANNQSQTADLGGLLIGNDSQVLNNTADNNYDVGIYVTGSDNVLRNNHATDSGTISAGTRCFYFANVDNAAIGNTATGCVYEFAGTYPTTVDRDNDGW